MSQDAKLKTYLDRVKAVYNVDCILNQMPDTEQVAEYYTQNRWGYSLFHSPSGSVHMALSSDGKFRRKDYTAQAEFIHRYIRQKQPSSVLELASGRGFNTVYLAQRHPDTQFTGVDVTPVHVQLACRKVQSLRLDNVNFEQGDFNELHYQDAQFDCAFAIESICYSLDLQQTLAGIHRVLKPGADLILFDCFKTEYADLTSDEVLATQLIEKSMALMQFPTYTVLMDAAAAVGFSIVEVEDLSSSVMPNLVRFENMARLFFAVPPLSKVIKRLLPEYFTQNAIAGLLMPIASERKILPYYRIILRRQ